MTKKQLEETARRESENSTVSGIALNAVIEGRVKWAHQGAYKIGVCACTAAHGGVVIVRFAPGDQAPHSSAYYWENWWPNARAYLPHDADGLHYKNAAIKAHALLLEEQKKGQQ